MRSRGPLRLVTDEAASALQDASPGDGGESRPPRQSGRDKPLSIGVSLAVWALMAALAWGVIALVLHLL